MEGGLLAAIIGASAALIGVAVAGAVAVYQVTKQARTGLKVELYKNVVAAIEKQSEAERELRTKLGLLNSHIALWLQADQFGGYRPLPNTSVLELLNLHYRVGDEGADLMILCERWQIVDARLDLFRLAFGAALHEAREAWPTLSELLSSVVPVAPGAPAPDLPDDETLKRTKAASEALLNAINKLGSWVADYQCEMQRLLLSDLFKTRLPYRQPIDSQFFVVRLDHYARLKRYFEEQSAWGQHMNAINDRLRRSLSSKE